MGVLDGVTPTIHHNGSEWYPPVVLTFLKISPNLIELRPSWRYDIPD
jgi:hypothetical protein